MVPYSPAEALGSHAHRVRDVLVNVIRSRHERAAEAHLVSGSRYSMGFGSQWRDLLDDVKEELTDRGYQSQKVLPAGYELPVVNDCLLYTWRVQGAPEAAVDFASSPTRKNIFFCTPPDPMLFDPTFGGGTDCGDSVEGVAGVEVESLVRAVGGPMPVVLVMLYSSPRQLQSIEWAVAELDEADNKVKLLGNELLWVSEAIVGPVAADIESFDHGTPVEPAIELREQEGTGSDAH